MQSAARNSLQNFNISDIILSMRYEGDIMTEKESTWLSILDYAHLTSTSISTVRRYIKSGRVKSKQKKGRYLILVDPDRYPRTEQPNSDTSILSEEIRRLQGIIKSQQEELDELRMLVALYENRAKGEGNSSINVKDYRSECPPAIPKEL